ncbi:MAG: DNA polymerase [Candidatus Pelagibacter sp.]|nr:DNA polymerase [Candidatus Pelagibacter sp.]
MSYELKEYLNAINFTKKDLMDSDDELWKKKYPAFIVNKLLSAFSDTIMLVNEMNRNHFIDKDMQFQFLLNSIRTKKRYSPFLRASKLKEIECVKEYYGYSNDKAKSALDILTKDEIKLIKEKLYKGGIK